MAIVRNPGERGDSGHDEQSQLQPDPGQETAHLQPVLQIHLARETINPLCIAPEFTIRFLHFLYHSDFSARKSSVSRLDFSTIFSIVLSDSSYFSLSKKSAAA